MASHVLSAERRTQSAGHAHYIARHSDRQRGLDFLRGEVSFHFESMHGSTVPRLATLIVERGTEELPFVPKRVVTPTGSVAEGIALATEVSHGVIEMKLND